MKSDDILGRLAIKHAEDVFVPECKVGPSYGRGNVRMDAWVMAKSSSHPMTTCYDIKVSRADFNHDKKWLEYLPFCNQFFFVVPHGIIRVEEVPEPAGLMYASENTTRLIVKKKSGYRDVEIPESIYRYILMARVKIFRGSEIGFQGENRLEFWKQWMVSKEIDYRFGRNVSKSIREEIDKKITEVREASNKIKEQNENLEDIKNYLKSIDIDYSRPYVNRHDVNRRLNELGECIGDKTMRSLEAAAREIDRAKQSFDNALERVRKEIAGQKNDGIELF